VSVTSAQRTSPALVVAYAAAYLVGSVVSYLLLSHQLGGLRSRRLLTFGGRLLIATGVSTALTFPVAQVLDGLAEDPGMLVAGVRLVCVTAVDVLLFLLLARVLRITEIRAILDLSLRRSRIERGG
jgi:putative peptidoglycan lipid II flippase